MSPLFLPTLVLVTLIGVRVIGVRVGWWRAMLIAWLGLITAGFTVGVFLPDLPEDAYPYTVPPLGVLAMIAWTGVFELLSTTRSEPLRPQEVNPLRALRRSVSRLRRTAEVALIAARFGLGRYARPQADLPRGPATGRALRGALKRAGGVYVKLGQFLSTRPDLVSAEIAAELRLLQEHVDPIPPAALQQVLTAELGDLRAALAEFDPDPVGAASIAQVHRAVLTDGRRVAVKVQRPDVAARVERDLDILLRLAERLERRTQWAHELRVLETAEAFARTVTGELDFEAEARNLIRLAAAIDHHPGFVVPQPVTHLTSTRVLVMEWVQGAPLTSAVALPAERRAELARALLRCLLDQILVAGTFHADPHPGNLYLIGDGRTGDGRVALLDGGTIGQLDRRQRSALQAVLAAVVAQDPAQLRDALRPMTTASRTIDERALERALGVVLVDHLTDTPGAGATPGAELMTALMTLMREFGLALEPVVAGALRALATVQSTLELLDPGFDLISEAKAYGMTLVNPLWSATHTRSPREELQALLPGVLPTLAALPRRLDRIIESVEHNEVAVGVHLFPSDRDRRFVDRLVAQLAVTLIPAATGLIGALLLLAANPLLDTSVGRIVQAVGLGSVGLALLVLLSTLVSALRRHRQRA